MADSGSEEMSRAGQETRISLANAVLILVGTVAVILVVGLVIGYTFFWNKYTLQTPVDVALQSSLQAVRETPADPAAQLRLGYVYLVRGEAEKAMQHYREAYSLDPKNRQIRYNLALGCIATDQYDEAIELLKPLTEEGILDFDAHFTLGTAYLKAGQYNNSIKAFEEALAIRGGAADAYYYIGQAYEGLGNREKALASYDKALRFVPNYPEVMEAKARLTGTTGGSNRNES